MPTYRRKFEGKILKRENPQKIVSMGYVSVRVVGAGFSRHGEFASAGYLLPDWDKSSALSPLFFSQSQLWTLNHTKLAAAIYFNV